MSTDLKWNKADLDACLECKLSSPFGQEIMIHIDDTGQYQVIHWNRSPERSIRMNTKAIMKSNDAYVIVRWLNQGGYEAC